MSAHVVGDDRVRYAVCRELEGRQQRALVARPRLVYPDMDGNAHIVRHVDWRERGAPVDTREPACIAMGEDLDRASCRRAVE